MWITRTQNSFIGNYKKSFWILRPPQYRSAVCRYGRGQKMCALIEHGNGVKSLLALDSSDMDAHRYSCTENKTNTKTKQNHK
jgi:hypothetical protein